MARQFAISDTAPHNPRFADAFVIFSVTVLSLAIGAWCLLRLGLALWAGTVAALGIYTALLSLHLLLRRSFVLDGEGADTERGTWVSSAMARAEADRSFDQDQEEPYVRTQPLPPEEETRRWAEATAADHRQLREELPPPRAADAFDFRPSQPPSLSFAPPEAAEAPPLTAAPHQPKAPPPEMSVEAIQDLIKKLADELSATTSAPAALPEPAGATDAMIGRSVAALQGTARPMQTPDQPPMAVGAARREMGIRTPAWPKVEAAPQGDVFARPADMPPTLNPQLARIAEAVAAERMEVLLEPIHALAEGRPRHFEVSVRLLTADGAALEQCEFSRATRGTGLMPRIDAARMVRAARVARRLGERGRKGAVLAMMDGASLTDESFLATAAAEPSLHTGMGLVLSFAQSEVRAFSPGHAQALMTLAAAGFRFALEEVTDLDMDFAALKEMGVAFVKLDAPVFLEGLPAAGGRVPASDICRHLADFGLTLIVGRIEDDWLLARILGFGVLFGKGALFGEPRLVKDEVVAAPAPAG